jgi:uncharacterized protein DUF3179
MFRLSTLLTVAVLFALAPQSTSLPSGWDKPFDVTRHSVPLDEIVGGGPPKDGIPALDTPRFVPASKAKDFLSDNDRVLGVAIAGAAKAYPIRILNWHEIVNDDVNGHPITVTW